MLLVFGSVNLDFGFHATRLPRAGETVLAEALHIAPGGKGANQAHAARRHGAPVRLVAAVGHDALATPALAGLQAAGVDLSGVQQLPGATGCASIAVDAQGENQIIVAPGVNRALRHDAVDDATLAGARLVLLQMETDPAQNDALLRRARRLGVPVWLNNAPAQRLAPALLEALDVLVVNRHELAATVGNQGSAGVESLAVTLAERHGLTVVVTLGTDGALACGSGLRLHQPAHRVPAVDATGAGDTFVGVLAAAHLEGLPLPQALRTAAVAAALACTRRGAQPAQPLRAETEAACQAAQARAG